MFERSKDCSCTFFKEGVDSKYTICISSACSKHFVGRKYAAENISQFETILKVGLPIASASTNLFTGQEINSTNTKSLSLELFPKIFPNIEIQKENFSFMGYKNPNGGYATRKNILIISTVSCVNSTVTRFRRYLESLITSGEIKINDIKILELKHSSGCGHVADEIDVKSISNLISGHIKNPNCFGCVIFSLGCEDNQYSPPDDIKDKVWSLSKRQDFQSEEKEFSNIIESMKEKITSVNQISRERFPLSNLKIALQCGGSDGLSGITANPLVGALSDFFNFNGGTTVLAETPEISGCRDWIMSRIKSDKAKKKLINIFNYWDQKSPDFIANPAPGNFKGGILNIFEKSLGSALKGGFSEIKKVLNYGEFDNKKVKGLTFMDSPGYDPCSITGQVSSGANLIIFTTGRGSNYENEFVPTIKVASNKHISVFGSEYIDFDASDFANAEKRNKLLNSLVNQTLEIASGKKTKGEKLGGVGEIGFVPWQRGSTV